MIADEVLYRRAIRYVCDVNNLTVESLTRLDSKTLNLFEDYASSVVEDMRFNQLQYFRPFQYQKDFYATGATCDRRGILAANRVGKTVSTCYEAAYHLTGLYPEWWVGKRFDKPVTIFAAGEGWSQVAMVLQNELVGTPDSKLVHAIGTGAIPRDCIVFDTMRSDGPNITSIEVKHISGQRSRLVFGNYTQEVRNLQGFKLDLCILDEQPPDDFFSELVTRTATTQGQVICSFTPLKGVNGLVSKFWEREVGYDFIRVSWNDVSEYDLWGEPFLLKSTRDQLTRDFMPHEREARIAGIPVMGHGAVFQLRHWPTYKPGEYDWNLIVGLEQIIALDLGLVNDSTVITRMYYQPRTDQIWLDKQIIVTGIEEANPTNYIHHLKLPAVYGCPIVLPADAGTQGRYTMSALSIRELFEQHGLNVIKKPIMNPPDSEGKITNHKSFGINEMRQRFEAGTLLINENCVDFLKQARNYSVDEKGRFSDPDDCIDSARYAVMGILNGLSEPINSHPRAKMFEAKERIHKIIEQKKIDKPVWKQTQGPGI